MGGPGDLKSRSVRRKGTPGQGKGPNYRAKKKKSKG